MKTGVERIKDERDRQIALEGYDKAHDNAHANGELALAAEAYLRELRYRPRRLMDTSRPPEEPWPWEGRSWKPKPDPIRQLEIVGALVAAELDRLLRERGEL
jgi:hypothetical protein